MYTAKNTDVYMVAYVALYRAYNQSPLKRWRLPPLIQLVVMVALCNRTDRFILAL